MQPTLDQKGATAIGERDLSAPKVLCLFGTRPEVIKFAPVIRALENRHVPTCIVSSAQHVDLIRPLIEHFDIRIDHSLNVMRPHQTLDGICARVLEGIGPVLASERPDAVLVQGDTTTAMAGALAAFHAKIPVGHIEAGLRSGNRESPFPEEMNRRLITRLASFHFAATTRNIAALIEEGVDSEGIFHTGNPVIDSLLHTLKDAHPGADLQKVLTATKGLRRIVLTTHRRESFGERMHGHLAALRDFVRSHQDVALIFPVHPNPNVLACAHEIFGDEPRVSLIAPLPYQEFACLLRAAWLIVSDSGGIQEEAPTLGKPLLIIRDTTERPEAVNCGAAVLVGEDPKNLSYHLEDVYDGTAWAGRVTALTNPFGKGDAGERIAASLVSALQKKGVAV